MAANEKNKMPDEAAMRQSAPPSYSDAAAVEMPPDLSTRLINLQLDSRPLKPTVDQCIAHLKLLQAFHNLRQEIGTNEGLFGIRSCSVPGPPDEKNLEIGVRPREKRWAIYVTRAEDRFRKWIETVPRTSKGKPSKWLTCRTYLTNKDIVKLPAEAVPLFGFNVDDLPPLGTSAHRPSVETVISDLGAFLTSLIDVLMVWHAYLLNPRCFLEDCIRTGMMDFYATGLPWDLIDSVIDSVTFDYCPSAAAQQKFETSTGFKWDNLADPNNKALVCPQCSSIVSVPWNSTSGFGQGKGYAENGFLATCNTCTTTLNHDYLRARKFQGDVKLLTAHDIPLPGAILGVHGLPEKSKNAVPPECYFPNCLLKTPEVYNQIVAEKIGRTEGITSIKSIIESSISQ